VSDAVQPEAQEYVLQAGVQFIPLRLPFSSDDRKSALQVLTVQYNAVHDEMTTLHFIALCEIIWIHVTWFNHHSLIEIKSIIHPLIHSHKKPSFIYMKTSQDKIDVPTCIIGEGAYANP
jgi:hypothetical protein